MSRWSLLAFAFVPALILLAQVDGGEEQEEEEVVDVRLRGEPEAPAPVALPDGGIVEGGVDGGLPPTTVELEEQLADQQVELERLRAELEQLREQEEALSDIAEELSGLREDVGKIGTDVDTFGTAAVERAETNDERIEMNTEGVDALRSAAMRLAYGDVAVERELAFAVGTLTGSAQERAAFALQLVRNGDYFNARTQLGLALEYAVRSQVVGTPAGAQPPR